jgi:hypothetical protein
MPTKAEYEARIKGMRWPDLKRLWRRIQARDTEGWEPGKAFEYLVLRMFDLDKAEVRWPYTVSLFGTDEAEEIDGSIRVADRYSLVESKDEVGNVAINPIAKMRSQLLRRPAGTMGFIFSSHSFTEAAVLLAHFALPQAVLLWSGTEVERALEERRVCVFAEQKYRLCVDEGIPDYNIAEL